MDVAMLTATTEPPKDITAGDVLAVVDAAAALVSRLVPGDVPLSWTGGIWSAFDRLERLGAAGKTLLAGRVAESGVWQGAGFAHPAEYLAQRSGSTVTHARETLAASRRIADLPATESKVRDGVLSTAQVQQITDAASHNPAAEAELLDKATDGSTLHELRDACGRAKAAADKDPGDRDKRLRAQRRLRQRRETDGGWSLWARGTLSDAAKFNAAIEQIIDDLLQDASENGEPLTREQAAYDALIEMANRINTTDWDDDEPDDADDLVETGWGDAADSGQRVGNGTGFAGAVHRQDDTSSRPGNDCPSSRGERTDNPSSWPGNYRTRHDADADRSDDTSSWPRSDRIRHEADAGLSDRPHGQGIGDSDLAVVSGGDRPDGSQVSGQSDELVAAGLNRRRRRRRRKAQPYLGIIRADLAALRRGHPVDGEVVEIAGLGPISVPEARELLGGDAVLQLVLSNGVHANVTNFRRSPNTAQRMALLAQMPCCSVKGCNRTWTQIDHRHDWAHTHTTRLEDLDPLCYPHHRKKSLDGWALVPGTGKRDFVAPTDPRHPDNQRGPRAGD